MQWVKGGNNFFIEGHKEQINSLPKGVYKLNVGPMGFYLTRQHNEFVFDYKIYGLETDFIQRVAKSFHATKPNMGVLLNGVKGTGKTVAAKQIANVIDQPVIIVPEAYDGLQGFINSVREDITLFFDEYEKMFSDRDSSMLTIMDGVLDNGYRRLFLLTTNQSYINDNMLQRPGRIRYVKEFTDLDAVTINEIIEDKLKHKQFRKEVAKFIAQLTLITVDIVKSVIEEVNIHEEAPEAFREVFNIKSRDNSFDIYELKGKLMKPKLISQERQISPTKFTKESIGQDFTIDGRFWGVIHDVQSDNTIVVNTNPRPTGGAKFFEQYDVASVGANYQSEDMVSEDTAGGSDVMVKAKRATPKLAKSHMRTFRVTYVERYHQSYRSQAYGYGEYDF